MLCWFKHAFIWVFQKRLQICVLQIMQNSTTHPKSQIINYIIIWIFSEGIFLMIKTRFYVKIAENLIFRHSLVIVHFPGMFWSWCSANYKTWDGQVRYLKYLAVALRQNGWTHLTFMTPTDTVFQKGHSSYQKYHLPKMESGINGLSQLHYWFSEVLPTPF